MAVTADILGRWEFSLAPGTVEPRFAGSLTLPIANPYSVSFPTPTYGTFDSARRCAGRHPSAWDRLVRRWTILYPWPLDHEKSNRRVTHRLGEREREGAEPSGSGAHISRSRPPSARVRSPHSRQQPEPARPPLLFSSSYAFTSLSRARRVRRLGRPSYGGQQTREPVGGSCAAVPTYPALGRPPTQR